MPKIKISVQSTTTVELDVGEGFPSEKVLDEFRGRMFYVEDGRQLLEYIASQVAAHGVSFVEGVGDVKARILGSSVDYSDIVS